MATFERRKPPYNAGMTAAAHSNTSPSISLHTAAILTGRSLRTWQRRIEDGLVPRLGDGTRAQVPFAVVQQAMDVALCPTWSAEDVQTLVDADQGDALAQAEMGAKFALIALRGAAAPTSASGGGGARSYAHRPLFSRASSRTGRGRCHALAGPAARGPAG